MITFNNLTSSGTAEKPILGAEILLDVPKDEEEYQLKLAEALALNRSWLDQYFGSDRMDLRYEWVPAKLIIKQKRW